MSALFTLWMHSLFSDVSVSLSEKIVSPPTSMYPYRAYIETLLSYGPAAKESQLTGVMWYKDTPGQQDKRTTDNKGFTAGNDESLWQLSQKHIVLNVIHVAGGYRVHFYFYSSDGVFTAGLFQCFHVTHSNGGTQLYLSHIQSHFLDLDFIIGRVCHESKSVPTSSQFMFLGQLPKRLVIACVDSDALNGAIGENPFDFKHYKINF
jgi:hypothetical protein